MLGPGPRFVKKKNLPGRGLTKVEKHCLRWPEDDLTIVETCSPDLCIFIPSINCCVRLIQF